MNGKRVAKVLSMVLCLMAVLSLGGQQPALADSGSGGDNPREILIRNVGTEPTILIYPDENGNIVAESFNDAPTLEFVPELTKGVTPQWVSCSRQGSGSGTFSVYFTPGRKGTHQIRFVNDWTTWNGGQMDSYWGRNWGQSGWNKWATSDVLSRWRTQSLYSGSADIAYKFVFRMWGYNAYYKLCVD